MFEFSPEQLFAFALSGVVFSAVLEYFPKLESWFNGLSDNQQRSLVLGSGVGLVLGAFGLECLELVTGLPWVCSEVGLVNVLAAYIAYIVASQSAYLILPRRKRA
jgi:hypothetical protein